MNVADFQLARKETTGLRRRRQWVLEYFYNLAENLADSPANFQFFQDSWRFLSAIALDSREYAGILRGVNLALINRYAIMHDARIIDFLKEHMSIWYEAAYSRSWNMTRDDLAIVTLHLGHLVADQGIPVDQEFFGRLFAIIKNQQSNFDQRQRDQCVTGLKLLARHGVPGSQNLTGQLKPRQVDHRSQSGPDQVRDRPRPRRVAEGGNNGVPTNNPQQAVVNYFQNLIRGIRQPEAPESFQKHWDLLNTVNISAQGLSVILNGIGRAMENSGAYAVMNDRRSGQSIIEFLSTHFYIWHNAARSQLTGFDQNSFTLGIQALACFANHDVRFTQDDVRYLFMGAEDLLNDAERAATFTNHNVALTLLAVAELDQRRIKNTHDLVNNLVRVIGGRLAAPVDQSSDQQSTFNDRDITLMLSAMARLAPRGIKNLQRTTDDLLRIIEKRAFTLNNNCVTLSVYVSGQLAACAVRIAPNVVDVLVEEIRKRTPYLNGGQVVECIYGFNQLSQQKFKIGRDLIPKLQQRQEQVQQEHDSAARQRQQRAFPNRQSHTP